MNDTTTDGKTGPPERAPVDSDRTKANYAQWSGRLSVTDRARLAMRIALAKSAGATDAVIRGMAAGATNQVVRRLLDHLKDGS